MRSTKKVVSIVMAVACLMALSIPAFAADTSTVTANVYVDGDDNTVPLMKGTTAYMTPGANWLGVTLPTNPSTNNATKTVDEDNNVTITIPLNNTIFRFVSFPDGTMAYKDTAGWSVVATDTDNDGYAEQMVYTFPADENGEITLVDGQQYRIADCNCYALPASIVGDNAGAKTLAVSMMVGQTPS